MQMATQSCKSVFYMNLFYRTSFFFCVSLDLSVSCQKQTLFQTIASQYTLGILGLTETCIRSEDSTPIALSNHFPFFHTPSQEGYWSSHF